jgi:hypothetical protein
MREATCKKAIREMLVNLLSVLVVSEATFKKAIRKIMIYLLTVSAVSEATCTWSGQLPPRQHKNPVYSQKVFVGGVPWDIREGTFFSPLYESLKAI